MRPGAKLNVKQLRLRIVEPLWTRFNDDHQLVECCGVSVLQYATTMLELRTNTTNTDDSLARQLTLFSKILPKVWEAVQSPRRPAVAKARVPTLNRSITGQPGSSVDVPD